jgi:exopolysaccharide biosynthesis WecB/TagA/CpsF family protein
MAMKPEFESTMMFRQSPALPVGKLSPVAFPAQPVVTNFASAVGGGLHGLLPGVVAPDRRTKGKSRQWQPNLRVDNCDLARFTGIAAAFGQGKFGYVVTPNADHLIRLNDDSRFRSCYADADYVLFDSRFLSVLLRAMRGLQLPVCTGSDLTAALFNKVVQADDPLVVIGGSDQQAAALAARYGLKNLAHFNPPMGFIHDPEATEQCLRFIELHSPFRFCFLCVGAPQQEILAQRLKQRGSARGLALCIGASINFLTGAEKRAPGWVQGIGMEWMYRLLMAPGRMTKRYLVRGPRVFGIALRANIRLQPLPLEPRRAEPVAAIAG